MSATAALPHGYGRASPAATARTMLAWECGPAWLLVLFAVAAATAGQASAMALLYPALAFCLAGYLLLSGRGSAYVLFCLWLFVLTPFVRRYIDLQIGWSALSTVLLAPYLAAGFSLVHLRTLSLGRDVPLAGPILVILGCAAYGLLLAALNGQPVAGGFDFLRWALPPCFAVQVMQSGRGDPALSHRLIRFFTLSVSLAGAYGFYQYVELPVWDAFWMAASNMDSIGVPEPFRVRVFSVMNSPGSFGSFLMIALLYLYAFATPLRLPALGLGAIGLILAMTRGPWGGLATAAVFMTLIGPLTIKLRAAIATVVLVTCIPLALEIPELNKAFEARLNSVQELSGDTSMNDRSAAYASLSEDLGRNLLGDGLGTTSAVQRNADGRKQRVVDSQIIETYLALGLWAGTAYLVAALACLGRGLLVALRSRTTLGLASASAMVAVTLTLLYGSMLVGEVGIFAWTAVALCHLTRPVGAQA